MTKKSKANTDIVCMHDVFRTLGEVITSAPEKQRNALHAAINGYADSFPEEYFWATGAQSPALLRDLMMTIDITCQPIAKAKPKSKTKTRRTINLADSKTMGNA